MIGSPDAHHVTKNGESDCFLLGLIVGDLPLIKILKNNSFEFNLISTSYLVIFVLFTANGIN